QGESHPLGCEPALLVALVQVGQLAGENRRLDRIEPARGADDAVTVTRALTVAAQQADAVCELRAGRDDGAAVSPASEVLGGVERERSGVAYRSHPLPPVARAVRLGGILEHEHAIASSALHDRGHVYG